MSQRSFFHEKPFCFLYISIYFLTICGYIGLEIYFAFSLFLLHGGLTQHAP